MFDSCNLRLPNGYLTAAVLLAVLITPGVVARAGDEAKPAQHLASSKQMTAETRVEFKARMGRHGNTMSNLVRAVVLLDQPTIRTLAGRIADEEVIARAEGAVKPGTKLFSPPQEFYDEQDALRASAQRLAGAAIAAAGDKALGDEFATLARTCVSCHSAYLRSSPIPQTLPPGTTSPNPSPRR